MPLEHTASHAEVASKATTSQPAAQVSVLQSINAEVTVAFKSPCLVTLVRCLCSCLKLQAFAQAKALFTSADAARTGRLSLHQWTSALLGRTDNPGGNTPEALKQYFVRIDADADGYITWRDLSTYMISQKSGQAIPPDI